MTRYVLMLNDMREPNIENLRAVQTSLVRDELVEACRSETVPYYRDDDRWGKNFRKDGPLEWFNPPATLDDNNDFFGGIYTLPDDVTESEAMSYRLWKR